METQIQAGVVVAQHQILLILQIVVVQAALVWYF
jgi:hypothetical protein